MQHTVQPDIAAMPVGSAITCLANCLFRALRCLYSSSVRRCLACTIRGLYQYWAMHHGPDDAEGCLARSPEVISGNLHPMQTQNMIAWIALPVEHRCLPHCHLPCASPYSC